MNYRGTSYFRYRKMWGSAKSNLPITPQWLVIRDAGSRRARFDTASNIRQLEPGWPVARQRDNLRSTAVSAP
jgi:hypothetical protein